jgi:putative transposase
MSMKRGRFTEEGIIGILREQEAGSSTGRLPQARGLERDVLQWKGKRGGLEVSDAERPKALEDENAKIKEAAGRVDAQQRHTQGGGVGRR